MPETTQTSDLTVLEVRRPVQAHWAKTKVSQGCVPSGGPVGKSIPSFFPLLEAPTFLGLCSVPQITLISARVTSPSLTLPHLSSSSKNACDYVGPSRRIFPSEDP